MGSKRKVQDIPLSHFRRKRSLHLDPEGQQERMESFGVAVKRLKPLSGPFISMPVYFIKDEFNGQQILPAIAKSVSVVAIEDTGPERCTNTAVSRDSTKPGSMLELPEISVDDMVAKIVSDLASTGADNTPTIVDRGKDKDDFISQRVILKPNRNRSRRKNATPRRIPNPMDELVDKLQHLSLSLKVAVIECKNDQNVFLGHIHNCTTNRLRKEIPVSHCVKQPVPPSLPRHCTCTNETVEGGNDKAGSILGQKDSQESYESDKESKEVKVDDEVPKKAYNKELSTICGQQSPVRPSAILHSNPDVARLEQLATSIDRVQDCEKVPSSGTRQRHLVKVATAEQLLTVSQPPPPPTLQAISHVTSISVKPTITSEAYTSPGTTCECSNNKSAAEVPLQTSLEHSQATLSIRLPQQSSHKDTKRRQSNEEIQSPYIDLKQKLLRQKETCTPAHAPLTRIPSQISCSVCALSPPPPPHSDTSPSTQAHMWPVSTSVFGKVYN